MPGEKAPRAFSMEELPGHLIGEVLTSGRLTTGDLALLEATCRALPPLVEHAASRLGQRIWEAVVLNELLLNGLGHAKQAFLTGCSAEIGVLYWHLDPKKSENQEELGKIRKARGYSITAT